MSELLHHAASAVRFVTERHDPERDAGQSTWVDAALADALSDAIQEIRKLAAKVERLEAQLQESKTP